MPALFRAPRGGPAHYVFHQIFILQPLPSASYTSHHLIQLVLPVHQFSPHGMGTAYIIPENEMFHHCDIPEKTKISLEQ